MDILNLLFSFHGRIKRAKFWLGQIILKAIVILVVYWVYTVPVENISLGLWIIQAVLVYSSLAVNIKRFHDLNKSGWWMLIYFIPVIGIFYIWIALGFEKGSKGPNNYGLDPLAPHYLQETNRKEEYKSEGITSNKQKSQISAMSLPSTVMNTNEPDLSLLNILMEKHATVAVALAHHKFGRTPSWMRMKEAFEDSVLLNLRSISYFMDNVIYQHNSDVKNEIRKKIDVISSYAALGGWISGREWAINYPALRDKLKVKNQIYANEVPADAMEHIRNAVNGLYSTFAEIFTLFYDSKYGHRTRNQKNAHLKDTYQGFMKGMLMCFLSGVKSLDITPEEQESFSKQESTLISTTESDESSNGDSGKQSSPQSSTPQKISEKRIEIEEKEYNWRAAVFTIIFVLIISIGLSVLATKLEVDKTKSHEVLSPTSVIDVMSTPIPTNTNAYYPTKTPTPNPIVMYPNSSMECIPWDEVNGTHIGEVICIYGKVMFISGEEFFKINFSYSPTDLKLMDVNGFYWPDVEKGQCIIAKGQVRDNVKHLYLSPFVDKQPTDIYKLDSYLCE